MDLSKLSLPELKAYQKQLEEYLKSPAKSAQIDAAAAETYTGKNPMFSMPQNSVGQKAKAVDRALATLGISEMPGEMTKGAKEFLGAYEKAPADMYLKNAPGAGKFMVDQFKKYGVDIAGKSENEILDLSKKFVEARRMAPNEEAVKAIFQKMAGENIAGIEKNLIRTAPEVTNVGKGLGAIARGAGKVASKLVAPVGVALTALDLGQALSEVQDKGAAKIAEDYKRSEEEKMGYSEMEKMNPIKDNYKQYTPEERVKLKDMLDKLRGNPKLRGSVSKAEYPTYNTPYDAVRDYLKYENKQGGKEFDPRNSYGDTRRV
jgi:hypothetical protein